MNNSRYHLLDWLRGFAILLMVIYHFCYDLYFFDYLDTQFGKGYWIPFRYVIVLLFLTLVGISLVLAHSKDIRWPNVRKRSFQLALASIFVTLSSYFIAPDKLTVFGILHFILLSSLLALAFIKSPNLSLVLGILVFSLGHLVSLSFFDPISIHWIGMIENKRPALDYVPLFPWFGAVLIGIFFGHQITNKNRLQSYMKTEPSKYFRFSIIGKINRWIELAGRHSLLIYLLHQPILFGAFLAVNKLVVSN